MHCGVTRAAETRTTLHLSVPDDTMGHMGSEDWKTEPATARQHAYLRRLATTHAMFGAELDPSSTLAEVNRRISAGLTGQDASDLIAGAHREGMFPHDRVRASDWQIDRSRNLAASLALFGLDHDVEATIARVEAMITGPFFSSQDAYDLMALSRRAAPHPTAQTPLRLSDIEGIENLNVSEGHYATFDDDDVLRFYRIYTPATGALRGVGVIRRFAGDNLLGLYPDEAKVVLEAINADPDGSAYRFSDTFVRCWICGKSLTDAVSRLLSVGPTCRGFANHTGLRHASGEVDHDPKRRLVFRALREWALEQGFVDPRSKEDRASIAMSASRLASAWSGVPGILALDPEVAVTKVKAVHTETGLDEDLTHALNATASDTLLILVESGILPAEVMTALTRHPSPKVRKAASQFFLAALTANP